MNRNFKIIAIWFILIGTIGLSFNLTFGTTTFTYLHRVRAPTGLWLWEIDIWGYMQNVKNSFTDVSRLSVDLPTRVWQTPTGTVFEESWWFATWNNMAVMLDYIIFTIDMLIYPMRVGGYNLVQFLAILGINITDPNEAGGLKWLVQACLNLKSLAIPYV